MTYEVFQRTAARVEAPSLSIVPDGRIAINAAAVRVLVDAGIKWVLLLWDAPNHRIAIKATHKGDKNAFAVSVASGRHSGSIRAKTFLAHVGWKARKREMVPAVWNERERMIEAALPTEHLEPERPGIKRSGG